MGIYLHTHKNYGAVLSNVDSSGLNTCEFVSDATINEIISSLTLRYLKNASFEIEEKNQPFKSISFVQSSTFFSLDEQIMNNYPDKLHYYMS